MRTLPVQLLAALRALLVLTLLLGLAYPLLIMGIGQVAFSANANGSKVEVDGIAVGSDLIGQYFSDPRTGEPLPEYFQPRPSAAGDGYDPTSTAASNRGPNDVTDAEDDPSLLTMICTRSRDVAAANKVSGARPYCGPDGVGTPGRRGSSDQADNAPVPPDAVTASGSGLDPHISPAYARLQVARVARERGLPLERVRDLLDQFTQGRVLGFLGEPRVNVLRLNLALDRLR